MHADHCWNCKRATGQVRSISTGIVYCAVCGAAVDGLGAVTDLSILKTEPVVDSEEGTDGK